MAMSATDAFLLRTMIASGDGVQPLAGACSERTKRCDVMAHLPGRVVPLWNGHYKITGMHRS
jgi:hypothetical protein